MECDRLNDTYASVSIDRLKRLLRDYGKKRDDNCMKRVDDTSRDSSNDRYNRKISVSLCDSSSQSTGQPYIGVALPPPLWLSDYNDYYRSLRPNRWIYHYEIGIVGSIRYTSVNYLNYLYSHINTKPIEPRVITSIRLEQTKCRGM